MARVTLDVITRSPTDAVALCTFCGATGHCGLAGEAGIAAAALNRRWNCPSPSARARRPSRFHRHGPVFSDERRGDAGRERTN
jgi:hypothetical protein